MTRLLCKKTLLGIIPLSERTIDALEQRGEFPSRIALTARKVVWDEAEVQAWIEARKQDKRRIPAPGITPP